MSLDVSLEVGEPTIVFSSNITHNLNAMASKAGLYYPLWRPEECGVETADALLPLLRAGLCVLLGNEYEMAKEEPPNGWGTYGDLVRFVSDYIDACSAHPHAKVRAFR